MKEIVVRTAVIGSGCAGLNAMDWLCALNEDALLITENMNAGASRNTGSDKQTYYKLSLAGDEGDSVGEMARTLKGPDVDGDLALCEAAGSVPCFLRLASLGVPFPQNEFGEYVGYQTDHDTRRRASSVGPLTSRRMTEALEASVLAKGARILDQAMACRILTGKNGVEGVLCLDRKAKEWIVVRCAHVVMCTGGPAAVYRSTVYPVSQLGMSGMAFEAGAEGANLDCWQYGLSSVKFRWNVSGSYQQAMPRYVSVDADGTEHDFLADALGVQSALENAFLKGYQWPYDPRKAQGSSRVDILVKREEDAGRRVYLDYRRNPTGWAPDALSDEAQAYLTQCGAMRETPIERLAAINSPAIALYRNHGIDLNSEMLEIRVCAQHHNGGAAVDSDWQTCVPGLYVCGEAAGTFGQYRPGGAALNSTQVGSMRAARHIARESARQAGTDSLSVVLPEAPAGDPDALTEELQSAMTRDAAFLRNERGIRALLERLHDLAASVRPVSLADPLLEKRLRLRDLMITQRQVLSAMLLRLTAPGEGVLVTRNGESRFRPARPLPQRDLWFESVWRKSREKERAQ